MISSQKKIFSDPMVTTAPDYSMASLLCLPLSPGKQFCPQSFPQAQSHTSPVSQADSTSSVLKLEVSLDLLADG